MIAFSHVSKSYGKGRVALWDISLEVREREFVLITGASGAGKSTLLRLVYGAERPDVGEIRVAGRDISKLRQSSIPFLRRSVGVVFQDFKLLPDRTALENVALVLDIRGRPRRQSKRRAEQALRSVGLEGRESAFPSELSGGEQQRVAVARALVGEPPILLADEPTGNLDPRRAKEILDLLVLASIRGITVVVATHDPMIMSYAAHRGFRKVRLMRGRVVIAPVAAPQASRQDVDELVESLFEDERRQKAYAAGLSDPEAGLAEAGQAAPARPVAEVVTGELTVPVAVAVAVPAAASVAVVVADGSARVAAEAIAVNRRGEPREGREIREAREVHEAREGRKAQAADAAPEARAVRRAYEADEVLGVHEAGEAGEAGEVRAVHERAGPLPETGPVPAVLAAEPGQPLALAATGVTAGQVASPAAQDDQDLALPPLLAELLAQSGVGARPSLGSAASDVPTGAAAASPAPVAAPMVSPAASPAASAPRTTATERPLPARAPPMAVPPARAPVLAATATTSAASRLSAALTIPLPGRRPAVTPAGGIKPAVRPAAGASAATRAPSVGSRTAVERIVGERQMSSGSAAIAAAPTAATAATTATGSTAATAAAATPTTSTAGADTPGAADAGEAQVGSGGRLGGLSSSRREPGE